MPTPTVIYKAETDLETDCWPPPRAKPPNPNRKPHLVDYHREPYKQKWLDPALREEDVNSILLPLAHLRLVDSPLIQRLTGWHERKVRYRLLELRKGGYLVRHLRPEFKALDANSNAMYHLTPKATYLLRMVFGGSVCDYKPATHTPRYRIADHILELSLIRICIEQGAQAINVGVGDWQTDRTVQSVYKGIALIPDQHFALTAANQDTTHYFHEHDRSVGMDNISLTWLPRLRKYQHLWQSGRFTALFGSRKRFTVLVTVLSEKRMRYLMGICAKYVTPELAGMFLFALLPDVTASNPLSNPIWRTIKNEARVLTP